MDRVDPYTEDCRYVDFRDDGSGSIVGVFDLRLEQA